MGFFDGYNIASSGMSAQRTRINVVSANIANAKTTHSTDGGPYKKQNVVFQEMLLSENEKLKANDSQDKQSALPSKNLSGVGIKQIVEAKDKPVMKFEPDHPDANADGYVAYPNINPVIEMVDLIEAMRSYEANVSAFTTTKTIDTKTLELLR
ncbi:flagellar basal body rod protein FlgC [Arcobacter sp. F2176]|uniref:flagellar basal body rod protein FlgC n=1 Tax=Arcobacter sp. F2176 TaxID=2044511 RepID=UPI00100BF5AF|nr:flagellar basal body rod protein FlgC [Arcobacter sp. F2176]RXJ80054.1 flagellar basal body rod protein FlgC [Arcobacter sp. F2176]